MKYLLKQFLSWYFGIVFVSKKHYKQELSERVKKIVDKQMRNATDWRQAWHEQKDATGRAWWHGYDSGFSDSENKRGHRHSFYKKSSYKV